MTRQQVFRRQIYIVLAIIVLIGGVVAVRQYLNTFGYVVQLGPVSRALLVNANGKLEEWTDEPTLNAIRAALPMHRAGAGFMLPGDEHESYGLVLIDAQGQPHMLVLPVGFSVMVGLKPKEGSENAWAMPELLGLLGNLEIEKVKAKQLGDPASAAQLEYWYNTFGDGKRLPKPPTEGAK
ncbi:MAG TPA: hypothetical protein VGM19_01115 [Armatimonadota bacterium]|jgi:hypothetical protein